MGGRWWVISVGLIGFLAGVVVGYCELMIRYHETGLTLGQFPFLLASRGMLGGVLGVLVMFRERIPLGRAVVIATVAVIGLSEALNWILFLRG